MGGDLLVVVQRPGEPIGETPEEDEPRVVAGYQLTLPGAKRLWTSPADHYWQYCPPVVVDDDVYMSGPERTDRIDGQTGQVIATAAATRYAAMTYAPAIDAPSAR